MRPIDADAMLAELKPITFEMEHSAVTIADMSNIMRSWVERQPTLTPQNEWVSVEERLPEELKMVLVYCGGLYDVAGWVKDERGEICWTCQTAPDFWRQIPELGA